jgi:hypothetical protein
MLVGLARFDGVLHGRAPVDWCHVQEKFRRSLAYDVLPRSAAGIPGKSGRKSVPDSIA